MGVAFGLLLFLAGVVLLSGFGDWATPVLSETTLGLLLLVCGTLAVLASVFVSERQPPSPQPRRPED